ncbi:MAG TPA: hypothetical protein VIG99_26860 [Myxococcaceae bacterium]|jgi:hypothetical protein
MAHTLSSRAALLSALLAGAAAAEHQEPAKSIPVPSIAAATLSSTGSLATPAISGDVNTNVSDTTLSASVKLVIPAGLGAELSVQSSQPSGGTGALIDNSDSIASGAQVSLAFTYGNYDLLPDTDPGVQAFESALHKCQAVSASRLREKGRQMDALRERQKKNALEEGDQDALAAREQSGCTFSESETFWLAERARSRPFLASVKGTLGRSDLVFLEEGTFSPVSDLVKAGVTVAAGQYVTSSMLVAASFRWSSGNVVGGAPANVCRQIDVDTAGNPVTLCDTGILGSPARGNLWRIALELRQLVGNGLIWAPSTSVSWADGSPVTVRAQVPLLFEVISNHEDQTPLLVGLTFGYAQVMAVQPVQSFTVAGTLQTQFALGKL